VETLNDKILDEVSSERQNNLEAYLLAMPPAYAQAQNSTPNSSRHQSFIIMDMK
jgi:hypothetical protein